MATSSSGGSADLPRDIRKRGNTYQVRVFTGRDPATGKQVFLTGSARTKREAVALRDRFRGEVAGHRAVRTNATLAQLVREWLATHDVAETTRANYQWLADSFVLPVLGEQRLTGLVRVGPKSFERLYAELRVCRRRCGGAPLVDHRTTVQHECDQRCHPHTCTPLAPASIRKIHAMLSGAFKAGIRWGWIGVNPMDSTAKPRAPKPKPAPPTTGQAARVVEAAWQQDDDWGTFVWLTFVTGARRGELIGLRWQDVDLAAGILTIERGVVHRGGRTIVHDTKTHQARRISLDKATVDILTEHRERVTRRLAEIGAEFSPESYVFSYAPDHSRPCSPDGITHRYSAMAAKLGIDTHLHALRHYSATEMLAAGVDLRTVAGRLGHGGGGATTLRVYAAWVQAADAQAAELLASRLPPPPRRSGDDAAE